MATKGPEHTLLGEGLAIGCVAAGIKSLPNDTSFDLDFRQAWREWPWSPQFLQVHAGPVRDDIEGILHRSANRAGPILAWWTIDRSYSPVLADDWELSDYLEVLHQRTDGRVPGTAWADLAQRIVGARARTSRSPQNQPNTAS